MKALLVGVAAESRSIVSSTLGARGHDPVEAESGVHALEIVRRDSPALVVVEDSLEDMTAVEIADCLELKLSTVYGRLRTARQAFDAAYARHRARNARRTL